MCPFPPLFFCFAPLSHALVCRKKQTSSKNQKPIRDDDAKYLFEACEWAKDEVTMDRAAKSVLMYSFIKDGLSRGERVEDNISHVESGQTFNVILHDHLYEEKKGGNSSNGNGEASRNVFPSGVDVIPTFTVIEVAINPANSKGFEEGWGFNLMRVRQCPFTLYSMLGPLGLGLLPSTHALSLTQADAGLQLSPGLRKVLEPKNTGFFGAVARGSYLVRHGTDGFRLVGPKEDPSDPLSKHLDVMAGGVFAVDISFPALLRFTNACETEEEDGLVYAQCLIDVASSLGALSCYVTHNEYLLRKDPNRSPFVGAPLIDTNKFLQCINFTPSEPGGSIPTRFPLPFTSGNMDRPFLQVDLACVDNNSSGEDSTPVPCPDLVLASENTPARYAYSLSLGDTVEEDFMRVLFLPKAAGASKSAGSCGRGFLERTDYRLLKKRKVMACGAGGVWPSAPPPSGSGPVPPSGGAFSCSHRTPE